MVGIKPVLVNPQNWTPFKPVPIENVVEIPKSVQHSYTNPYIIRNEMIRRNSLFINLIGLAIILGILYFLYSIYLERKLAAEYLEFLRNNQERTDLDTFNYNGGWL